MATLWQHRRGTLAPVSLYQILLFGHITCAMMWVGTGIGMQVLSVRARRGGPERMVEFLDSVHWVGNRLQGPAALLVVVFGILLVVKGDYGFRLWIGLALAAVVITFLIAAGYMSPETRRVAQLVGERGSTDALVLARIRRLLLVSRIELLILVAVILNMIVKPGQ
jgi:uncharacterized membrane protein